ncbi:hypothetical protein M427DRAFT_142727 [Gonapodya prolifera JEL478]|uniref:Sfi1 spindle body domain-containing protein n=1 Tax=Gonapodya prolifera (strain JEL478) TaxID=1344416 RepID=A0A139AUR4_GONPJ|nr:hypothetical protein M427DRAFT_142727 [Gonapodya prolifera JEL478]|eukprot:KXS20444.1 hypothetical protein M427DRAFT_142727 [Gonapodya prolifera JEL478]
MCRARGGGGGGGAGKRGAGKRGRVKSGDGGEGADGNAGAETATTETTQGGGAMADSAVDRRRVLARAAARMGATAAAAVAESGLAHGDATRTDNGAVHGPEAARGGKRAAFVRWADGATTARSQADTSAHPGSYPPLTLPDLALARPAFAHWRLFSRRAALLRASASFHASCLARSAFSYWRTRALQARIFWRARVRAECFANAKVAEKCWTAWRVFIVASRDRKAEVKRAEIAAKTLLLRRTFHTWRAHFLLRRHLHHTTSLSVSHHRLHTLRASFLSWRLALSRSHAVSTLECGGAEKARRWVRRRTWELWRARCTQRRKEAQRESEVDTWREKVALERCWKAWVVYVGERGRKGMVDGGFSCVYISVKGASRGLGGLYLASVSVWLGLGTGGRGESRRTTDPHSATIHQNADVCFLLVGWLHCRDLVLTRVVFCLPFSPFSAHRPPTTAPALARTHHSHRLLAMFLHTWYSRLLVRVHFHSLAHTGCVLSDRAVRKRAFKVWRDRLGARMEVGRMQNRADGWWEGGVKKRIFRKWRAKIDQLEGAGGMYAVKLAATHFYRWLWRRRALAAAREHALLLPGILAWRSAALKRAVGGWRAYVAYRKAKETRAHVATAHQRALLLASAIKRWRRLTTHRLRLRLLRMAEETYRTARLLRSHMARWVAAHAWCARQKMLMACAGEAHEGILLRRGLRALRENAARQKADRGIEDVARVFSERVAVRKAWGAWEAYVITRRERKEDKNVARRVAFVKGVEWAWEQWGEGVRRRREQRERWNVAVVFSGARGGRRVLRAWKEFARARSLARISLDLFVASRLEHHFATCVGLWRRRAAERVLIKKTVEVEVKATNAARLATGFGGWRAFVLARRRARAEEDKRVKAAKQVLKTERAFHVWRRLTSHRLWLRSRIATADTFRNKMLFKRAVTVWRARRLDWQVLSFRANVLPIVHWSRVLTKTVLKGWCEYVRTTKRTKERCRAMVKWRKDRMVRRGIVKWIETADMLRKERERYFMERAVGWTVEAFTLASKYAWKWRERVLGRRGVQSFHTRNIGLNAVMQHETALDKRLPEPARPQLLFDASSTLQMERDCEAMVSHTILRTRSQPSALPQLHAHVTNEVKGKRPGPRTPNFLTGLA